MTKCVDVLSGGELVGSLTDPRLDMWYLEGAFSPLDTPKGMSFASMAAALDPRAAMSDPTRGIRVEIREHPNDVRMTFIVMALSDGRLFGRCVFDPRAVAWTNRHVPATLIPRVNPPRRPWWRFW